MGDWYPLIAECLDDHRQGPVFLCGELGMEPDRDYEPENRHVLKLSRLGLANNRNLHVRHHPALLTLGLTSCRCVLTARAAFTPGRAEFLARKKPASQ